MQSLRICRDRIEEESARRYSSESKRNKKDMKPELFSRVRFGNVRFRPKAPKRYAESFG
jgi:hypothetical protein